MLLPSQENDLWRVIDQSHHFTRGDFELDTHSSLTGAPILRFKGAPNEVFLFIKEHSRDGAIYSIEYSPGKAVLRVDTTVDRWDGVVGAAVVWLANLHRQLVDVERQGSAPIVAPPWALAELPAEYHKLKIDLEQMAEAERRMRRMAGLLYESGEPLNKLVRDTFQQLGFEAHSTAPGTTYDVTVKLGSARLLVEVTGIDGQITKGSKKIAQVLSALQTEATASDRVCVAVNAQRDKPLAERTEVVSRDALALITSLNAVVFTTAQLFEIWKLSLSNGSAAKASIERLLTAPPGIVRLP